MRIFAYKLITHSRTVGFIRFKDGNTKNYNKFNLERVSLNVVLDDIYNKKNSTNWDILFSNEERNYIKKNSLELIKYIYDDDK